jgi:hypothetical protein
MITSLSTKVALLEQYRLDVADAHEVDVVFHAGALHHAMMVFW